MLINKQITNSAIINKKGIEVFNFSDDEKGDAR